MTFLLYLKRVKQGVCQHVQYKGATDPHPLLCRSSMAPRPRLKLVDFTSRRLTHLEREDGIRIRTSAAGGLQEYCKELLTSFALPGPTSCRNRAPRPFGLIN